MLDGRAFVVVGAGQAGAWICRTLRAEGFAGRILLLGEERHPPYERPPLSKSILSNRHVDIPVLLSGPEMEDLSVEWRRDVRVARIERHEMAVTLDDGKRIAYDTLFLATGGRARIPAAPGAEGPHIHVLRTLDNARRLRTSLARGGRLGVVGGGWIGLEVAAAARGLGQDVTVLEASARLCARSAPPVVSDYLAALHRRRGVAIETDVVVTSVESRADEIRIHLADGEPVSCDTLLLAVGIVPNVELAADAGLAVDDGVVVDAAGRTSDPAIYAAGDLTTQPCFLSGRLVRLETWANAQGQAVIAAKAALAKDLGSRQAAWLWSDQYDDRIQIGGDLVAMVDSRARVTAVGNPAGGLGSWLFSNEFGHQVGVVSINAPREFRKIHKGFQAGTGPRRKIP